jgi:hypothetical protein
MKILNASPGFGRELTENEVRNFLGNNKLNIHIGTIVSNIHPTWYFLMPPTISFAETSKNSKKKNLNRKNIIY